MKPFFFYITIRSETEHTDRSSYINKSRKNGKMHFSHRSRTIGWQQMPLCLAGRERYSRAEHRGPHENQLRYTPVIDGPIKGVLVCSSSLLCRGSPERVIDELPTNGAADGLLQHRHFTFLTLLDSLGIYTSRIHLILWDGCCEME